MMITARKQYEDGFSLIIISKRIFHSRRKIDRIGFRKKGCDGQSFDVNAHFIPFYGQKTSGRSAG